MKSILEALFCGEIYPSAQIRSDDPAFLESLEKIDAIKEKLKKHLGAEQGDLLEEMDILYLTVSDLHATASFVHGYRLGALTLMDVYHGYCPPTEHSSKH